MLLYGNPLYYRVGRRAVASVLDRTDFGIFLAVEPGNRWRLSQNPTSRVPIETVSPKVPVSHRSLPFLLKFQALQACLNYTRANQIMLLDADTVVVTDISGRDVAIALDPAASSFYGEGRYNLTKSGQGVKTSEAMTEIYAQWISK